ncbi:MAG: DUF6174 domain-containing protein [bacterium]
MGSRRQFLLTVFLSLAAIGCSDPFSPGGERSRLDTNRQKWQLQRQSTYKFTLATACFCAGGGPIRIEVSGDSVVAATLVSNGQHIGTQNVLTVEKLFDFIDRAIADHAVGLEITYHPILGYPTLINSGGQEFIADDEVTYTISDLTFAVPLDH